ncbi:MAG TPA: heat-inducible transcriptional repressor HrcA [Syntrophomonadaceae bacterium]|nr:heat-inducible transcriptional repressor HrcA [Syntrophomonadaceae bacterium]HQA06751.1 heat-inducible transcriptional repressor HrcA [Syntrophomonadaceae bacterium]HQE22616.1 heat-inducible transcriptional repressor HrcA [Syntrophomonadaceae bacterium]
MTLDERKRQILQSIIKDYVETAEPVGSRAVVRKHDLKISAATVRNEMADLEEMGYLEQPHTSAGRIPSEQGFRYYVDCMMENESLSEEQIEELRKAITSSVRDLDQVIAHIAQFLSQITRYTSFIVVPSVNTTQFRYLQLLPLNPGQALIILVTDLGLIMHRKIEIPPNVTNEDLENIGSLFNKVFASRRLDELRRTDLRALREELYQRRKVIDSALDALELLLQSSRDERVVVSGVLNMLNEPEFKDLEKLRRFLSLLEEEGAIKNRLPQDIGEHVNISIGRENPDDMKDMSVVIAGYKSYGEMGKIGVIGPVRMEYWRAAGTVEAVRDLIKEVLY